VTFTSVLVANRGEIARRVLRGARAMGLRTVAVYVDADRDAPFVTEADEAMRLPTGYLDGAAVLEAAERAGAEAVHPGYGFLSENADFAARVTAAGLTWVGPPSHVIAAMGDKIQAKRLALAAGVPTLASSEDPSRADELGFPVLVKAAGGGGGKGMRVVVDPADLDEAVAAARREALGGFGDDRVFLERYLARSRHVEVQILGDRHGALVHLGERECSVQRRHQKLIEESPSPVVDAGMRDELGRAALSLARAIGYESAGTVEFIVDDATRDFYFLEVNTRLQVEHPVTEEVTGIDLVREQLRLAQGERLGYTQGDVHLSGYAIEVRLCAEDPSVGFLPATGTLAAFDPSEQPAVRWESGVVAGSTVGVAFDPLLAKVIAHAPTRREAASTLARALERLHVGGVATNRDFLAAALRHEGFLAGETTTDFIERFAPARTLVLDDAEESYAACLGALWLQGSHRAAAPVLAQVPSGWRNARLPRQHVALRRGERTSDVHYRSHRDGTFDLAERGTATIHDWSDGALDATINGRRVTSRITRAGERLYVQVPRGTVDFTVVPRFEAHGGPVLEGGLHAPMPGLVLDVRVTPGERVRLGQPLVVLEAMKMEHVIGAPHAGIVREVYVVKGQQVDGGVDLLALDAAEPADVGGGG
jgi:propionyl-CoA carboxylase alpha chain